MIFGLILVAAIGLLVHYFEPAKQWWGTVPAKAKTIGVPLVALVLAIMIPGAGPIPGITTQANGWLPQTTLVLLRHLCPVLHGLNIVVGYAGLLDLGYVAFFLFGAYVAAWLMSDFWFVEEHSGP